MERNEIIINYGVLFFKKNGKEHIQYIFDLNTFQTQIPSLLQESLYLMSKNHNGYLCEVIDDKDGPGVFLEQAGILYDENPDNDVEFKKYIRINFEPISGKMFTFNHVLSLNITKLINLLQNKCDAQIIKMHKHYRNRTEDDIDELERLDKNLKILRNDLYTDEKGLHNVLNLIKEHCNLTYDEEETLYK